MRILILWRQYDLNMRNTIIDHAFCFKRYDRQNEYYYFNIYHGRYEKDYEWITDRMFDAVIFHYSALGLRTHERRYWVDFLNLMVKVWRNKPCLKILMPQDDYIRTKDLWDLANGIRADKIYTIIREKNYGIIYPRDKIGNIELETVLTGYVEESYLSMKIYPHKDRNFDVVYRGRKLPYEAGKLGQLKHDIATLFYEKLKGSGMKIDIDNTDGDQKALLGDAWISFLASSRLTIGCLGGCGFMDAEGELQNKIRQYIMYHPEADFEQTKQAVFPDREDELQGMFTPRLFESSIVKNCQVLVGDDFQGILEPNEDYIMLAPDFSNLDEVCWKMQQIDYCEQIAEKCYQTVVASRKYTYRAFVDKVVNDIKQHIYTEHDNRIDGQYILDKCNSNNQWVIQELKRIEAYAATLRRENEDSGFMASGEIAGKKYDH